MNDLTRKRAMSIATVAVVAGVTTVAVLWFTNKTSVGRATTKKVTG